MLPEGHIGATLYIIIQSGRRFPVEVKSLATRAQEAGLSRAEVSKLVVTVDPEDRSLKGRIAATENTSQKDTG
jgi:hypothetical protein